MTRIALATAIATAAQDEDMPALLDACARAGLPAEVRAWDDLTVSWARYDAVVLRSPWDYHLHRDAFLRWCERVARVSRLFNAVELVRWNTDKHYLADLDAAGVPIVPTRFVEPEADADVEPMAVLEAFLDAHHGASGFVVKPAVSAGSHDTCRYRREQTFAAANHLGSLLGAGRSAMLQPYLDAVDTRGETALLYFGDAFSHAIRKAALLRPDAAGVDHTGLPDAIAPRTPEADELAVGERVLAALRARGDAPPLYARVDLIRDDAGAPRLLELELTEPSLFLAEAPGAADRFVDALIRRLQA
jgi:O-ureido-D-serine cyclo-ligase